MAIGDHVPAAELLDGGHEGHQQQPGVGHQQQQTGGAGHKLQLLEQGLDAPSRSEVQPDPAEAHERDPGDLEPAPERRGLEMRPQQGRAIVVLVEVEHRPVARAVVAEQGRAPELAADPAVDLLDRLGDLEGDVRGRRLVVERGLQAPRRSPRPCCSAVGVATGHPQAAAMRRRVRRRRRQPHAPAGSWQPARPARPRPPTGRARRSAPRRSPSLSPPARHVASAPAASPAPDIGRPGPDGQAGSTRPLRRGWPARPAAAAGRAGPAPGSARRPRLERCNRGDYFPSKRDLTGRGCWLLPTRGYSPPPRHRARSRRGPSC